MLPRRVAAILAGLCLAVAACGQSVPPQADGPGGTPLGGGGTGQPKRPGPPPAAVPLTTSNPRASGGVIGSAGPDAPYNYAPSVMLSGGTYRMWWCSQVPGAPRPGDQIRYAESSTMDGPFSLPGAGPSGLAFGNSADGFDALHTCDPSVIAAGGQYYLYYTGTADPAGNANAIGLATSTDGITWTRANNGAPIVSAAGQVHRANAYGAGQPSVVFLNGWFYLMFTDTTGAAATQDGEGQFVLRSTDPTFAHNVQALGPNGFASTPSATGPRTRSVVDATTSDLMWVDTLGAFAIAQDTGDGTTITFWDADFAYHPYQPITIPGPWREGPGFVRRADGHAPVSAQDPCGQVSLDVVRATTLGAGPTDLRHFGIDVTGLHGCANSAQAAAVLNGFAMPAPDRTIDLVVNGQLVEVERRSVAAALSVAVLPQPVPQVGGLPVAARLTAGVPAEAGPDGTVGLLVDGRLWLIGSANVAVLNGSSVQPVPATAWQVTPRGADLRGLKP